MVEIRILDEELPMRDDGWWVSVLADEESMSTPVARPKKAEESENIEKTIQDWEHARTLYKQDQMASLRVTGCNRGGLLVEGEGLNGFVPCSHLVEMPGWVEEEQRDRFLAGYIGRTLNLKIIECVQEESRMVFSERAAKAGNGRRTALFNSLKPGLRVNGEVTNITEFGVFVDLGGMEGLIHISELSWGRVNHPSQVLHLGETVEVMVLEVAPERCRVALSLKQLHKNPWEMAEIRYPVNQIIPVEITALVPFGAFARLEEGLEGLIHISEIPLPENTPLGDFLAPGQQVQVRVLQVDVSRQRLGLSLKV